MTKKKTNKFSSFLNNPVDFTLVVVILLLLSLGLVMVLSASSPSALSDGNSYSYFIKQAIFAVAGLGMMVIISKIDYRFYKKYYILAYAVSILLLIAVLAIGKNVNGATRWIYIGTDALSVQPSEIVKFLMIIFYAAMLTKNRDRLEKYGKGFWFHFALVLPIIGLLIAEPHLSASIVIIGIISIMMIVAGCKFWHFLVTGVVAGIPVLTLLIVKAPYRLQRVTTFLNPWKDMRGDGWQVIQSLYAIGSGGLFGAGLGESKQKYLYIPEPHNDFIFSILAEELGFIGCAAVLILFGVFIWRGVLIAMKAPDMFGSLVAIGITAQVAIQVIINIAVVTSSMPATGMPLPFFSYGGSALFILLCEMGVLLNISKAGAKRE